MINPDRSLTCPDFFLASHRPPRIFEVNRGKKYLLSSFIVFADVRYACFIVTNPAVGDAGPSAKTPPTVLVGGIAEIFRSASP